MVYKKRGPLTRLPADSIRRCIPLSDQPLLRYYYNHPIAWFQSPDFYAPGLEQAWEVQPCEVKHGGKAEQQAFRWYSYCRWRLMRQALVVERAPSLPACLSLIVWVRRAFDVRNAIMVANDSLVIAALRRSQHVKTAQDFDEKLSEGRVALLRTIERFDYTLGFRFSTYAYRSVVISFARLNMATYRQNIGFQYQMDWFESEGELPQELVREAPRQPDLDGQIVRGLMQTGYTACTSREIEAINHRFGLNGHESKTLQEVGEVLGVSKERIRQLVLDGLRKIRVAVGAPPVHSKKLDLRVRYG